jgi:hypothetical protein
MKGKKRCKILKEIRKKIAENNDIEFITSECKHQGDCLGTCPKCEAEVRYLERELEKRQKLGRTIAVAGLAVALTTTSTGCDELFDSFRPTGGEPLPPEGYEQELGGEDRPSDEYDGDIAEIPAGAPQLPEDEGELGGEPLPPDDSPEDMGDIPAPDDDLIEGEIIVPDDDEDDEDEDVELGGDPMPSELAGDIVE